MIEMRKKVVVDKVPTETDMARQRLALLFDNAIRFAERGMRCIGADDKAGSAFYIGKSQAIVQELQNVLRHQAAPELCGALSALYTYVIEVLTAANVHHDASLVDEAVDLLKTVRTGFGPLAGDE